VSLTFYISGNEYLIGSNINIAATSGTAVLQGRITSPLLDGCWTYRAEATFSAGIWTARASVDLPPAFRRVQRNKIRKVVRVLN
jgi:hypothetical protein